MGGELDRRSHKDANMPASVSLASLTATRPAVRWTEIRTKPSSGIADVSRIVAFRFLEAAIQVTVRSCST